eukprot:gnl/MRDRNA2_/MRDRNA2_105425_c0_seq1.p1 gnl/MRDRNA2_/MRDRNA2_105425_c0~~gnl/MRDRNA2_/MRDRNA2_105425_c0_seq1.p1  ORF type:complete len:369 (-),score=38.94 gnl/MRDRNA2_/MRDRNA2_105425_c0_seq1:298-1404(-)
MPDSLADPLLQKDVPRSIRYSTKALILLCPLVMFSCMLLWNDGATQYFAVHKPINMAWKHNGMAQSKASHAMRPLTPGQSLQPLRAWQPISAPKGRFGPAYAHVPSEQEMVQKAEIESGKQALLQPDVLSRRGALLSSALTFGSRAVGLSPTLPAFAGTQTKVGAYLPESTVAPGLYDFKTGQQKTGALRAQVIYPYSFALPGDWFEQGVSNAINGNYCMPKCGDQTTEVKFTNPKEGNLNVILIPAIKLRLTDKEPKIEQVGDPMKVIEVIGQSVTNSVNVEPEEVESAEIMKVDGKTYYVYNLFTPYATSGTHNVAVVTTNAANLILLTIASNDKQWGAAKDTLLKIPMSFRVGSEFEAKKVELPA